jgi:polysaccharide export outer membrane protein
VTEDRVFKVVNEKKRFGIFSTQKLIDGVAMKCISLQALVLGVALVLSGLQAGHAQSASGEKELAAGAATDTGATNKPHDDRFVIGNDDVLAISVWNEPNLSKSIPVRSDGKISLPLVGELQAAGKTPLQLERDVTEKLKGFITAPEVNVIVEKVNSRKFNILGEVSKPGSYPLTASMTIMDGIAIAGGFRDFAKKSGVYILRKTASGQESRLKFNYKDFIKGKDVAQNIKLEPDDTVIVP